MKHWRGLTAIVVAMGLLGGCQSDGEDEGLLIDSLVAQQLDYTVDWQIDLALPAGAQLIYVELLGDRLVTVEDENIVSVINADNGQIMWRHQITRPQTRLSRPRRDGEQLVISSQTRAFVLDLNSGDLEDIIDLHKVSLGTPVIVDGRMIHASPQGVLYAQDIADGGMRWDYQIDIGFASPPTLAGGQLFATDLAGNVLAFDPTSGRLLWERQVAEPAVARPVAGERLVYVPSIDQSLYALLLTNGRQQWRYYATTPLEKSPFLVDDLLLLEEPEDSVVSLDTEEGEVLWRSEELVDADPLQLRGETIDYFENSTLLHVDSRDGQVLERTPLHNVDHVIAESQTGGELYLVGLRGRILKASPR